jgi:hypothetical protein
MFRVFEIVNFVIYHIMTQSFLFKEYYIKRIIFDTFFFLVIYLISLYPLFCYMMARISSKINNRFLSLLNITYALLIISLVGGSASAIYSNVFDEIPLMISATLYFAINFLSCFYMFNRRVITHPLAKGRA